MDVRIGKPRLSSNRAWKTEYIAKDVDHEIAGNDATEGGGDPKLLVVAAATVEADPHGRGTNAISEFVDIVGEVHRARLLGGLNGHDNARMGNVWRRVNFQKGECRSGSI